MGREDALGRGGEEGIVGQCIGQHVAAVDGGAAREREVVEAEHLGIHRALGDLEPFGDGGLRAVGAVADPDCPFEPRIPQGLRHQACRIREVEKPCLRTHPLEDTGIIQDGRDAAQRHGKPAGTGRLLTEHARTQGNTLVSDTTFDAAGPDRRNCIVGAIERRFDIGGGGDGDLAACAARKLIRQCADQRKLVWLDIHEADFGEADPIATAKRRLNEERRTQTSPTDERQLHGVPHIETVANWLYPVIISLRKRETRLCPHAFTLSLTRATKPALSPPAEFG
ncbi:hypothetical protein [Devosia sp. DBB001]|nr:hypothetical protein [Devosia sp. DBB001]